MTHVEGKALQQEIPVVKITSLHVKKKKKKNMEDDQPSRRSIHLLIHHFTWVSGLSN